MVFINCQELVTFLTPLMIIIHNYARVSYTLIKSMKQNAQLMEGSQQENDKANEDIRKRIKVIKMLMAILIIFIICWTPRVLLSFSLGLARWAGIDFDKLAIDSFAMVTLYYSFRLFSYFNSIVNVVIYHLTSNQFNMAFKRILTCGKYGKEERIASMITQSSLASTSFAEKEKPK